MRDIIRTPFLVALALLCLANVVIVGFIYARYSRDSESVRNLEYRVQEIAEKTNLQNRWETRTITLEIVTASADSSRFGRYALHLDPQKSGPQRFELEGGKYEFRPVGAWVSEWEPHGEMLKFDEFRVVPNSQTRKIELYATVHTNQTVDMMFTITVLNQYFER